MATWIFPVTAECEQPPAVLGGKGSGLVLLRRLGLPVPPAFVISTAAGRAFLRDGRLPDGLAAELAAAVAGLEAATGRVFGGPGRPLVVAVRSGASVSMPGMMSTVLNVGLSEAATAALAAETGDPGFAHDSRRRLLTGYTAATGEPPPEDPERQLSAAVRAVFSSWNSPRARTYRELNDIPHDLGTAVTVQAMVFGNRDARSGTGVAFSRDPMTGEPVRFGEVLVTAQGEEVVAGTSAPAPLAALAEREPAVWSALVAAMQRLEQHYRKPSYVEFTYETGRLWLLQVRPGHFGGAAAVRVAVDLAGESVIDRGAALLRVRGQDLQFARTPRLAPVDPARILGRGVGACPGVAAGRVATTAERAARMAAAGPVVLVRPHTSPADLSGLAAAAGIVTARGGPGSHAAVVARSLGKPAVVGVTGLTVDPAGAVVRAGAHTVAEGDLLTIDGTSGEVVIGSAPLAPSTVDRQLRRLLGWADELTGGIPGGSDQDRLAAAHRILRERQPPPNG